MITVTTSRVMTAKSLLPPDNYSRIVHFVVNMNEMTVMRPFEYGKELGARGYSSCVSAKAIQQNGNIVVHFADCTFDENGRAISCQLARAILSIRRRAVRRWGC